MRTLFAAFALVAVATGTASTAASTSDALAVVSAPAPAAPEWRGDRHAMPSTYAWLGPYTPSDTYTVVVVRGMGVKGVLRGLGPVKRKLADRTPGQAEGYVFHHMEPDYSPPMVAQVHRRGHAVMVYLPYGVLADKFVAKMSRRGLAAAFFTNVEHDTYVTVAKRGRVVRQFDAGFKPPKRGALPREKGLDWGKPKQNIWATAWAFTERLTRTHISRTWFEADHPTYVLRRRAF